MKAHRLLSMLIMAVSFASQETGVAETRYVSLSGGHVPPFTNWADAARDIQTAIDASEDGDTVLVSNGVYATGGRVASDASLTNRIVVTNAITVRSVNGRARTVILGQGPLGDSAIRCAYLADMATISGFTLSNGCTRTSGDLAQDQSGGGVVGGYVSDCLITGNSAQYNGGGTFYSWVEHCDIIGNTATNGGGAYGGYLFYQCHIRGNTAERGGGVSLVEAVDCVITSNSATYGGGSSDSANFHCTIKDNVASADGGGDYNDVVEICAIRQNRAAGHGGGLSMTIASNCCIQVNQAEQSGGGAYECTLYSSLVSGNSAGNVGGGQDSSTLYSCTVVGNEASNRAGGCYAGVLINCIVWSNRAASDTNFWGGTYTYCCATPNPDGIGNMANDPRFVSAALGDYQLQSNSPCVNAGTNQDWMIGATDLHTNDTPRICGGRVDMGAYERAFSRMPDDWLTRYGLALDGSDDFQDNDNDGMNNWREWRCETDPTNRLSLLTCIMDSAMVTPTGIVVCWQSVAGKMYTVERSANLNVSSPFIAIATDILAEAESTTHTDTTVVGEGPYFYRVGVK
jgi:hypothetical protein